MLGQKILFSSALLILFGPLVSCRPARVVEGDSDLDSISFKTAFPGMSPDQVENFIHPIRMEVMNANEALCVIPFGVSYEEWDDKTALSTEALREIEGLVRKFGNQYVIEAKRDSKVYAANIAKALDVASDAGMIAAAHAGDRAAKVKAYADAARPVVEKAVKSSNALYGFFNTVQQKYGFSTAHRTMQRLVPKLASLENNTWKVIEKSNSAANQSLQNLDRISNAAASVQKTAPLLAASLEVLSAALSAYSNTLLVCNVSNGIVGQLELWELEAIQLDPSEKLERKQKLKSRYCLAHRRLNNGQEPKGVTCPR